MRRATVPVLAIRPDDTRPGYPYRNVLVPTDGSDCARKALETGVHVATVDGSALHVLSVVDMANLGIDVRATVQTEHLEAGANEVVRAAVEVAEDAGVESVVGAVESGPSIHRTIPSYVDEHDVDLVVVGTHGRTGLDRYVLGSITQKLLRTAPVPVLLFGSRRGLRRSERPNGNECASL